MPIAKEMPKYRSHKKVWALKIKEVVREEDGSATIVPEEKGYLPFKVKMDYVAKHIPRLGGYYVQYEDGYESWSPAEVFEKGYTRIV